MKGKGDKVLNVLNIEADITLLHPPCNFEFSKWM